MPHVMSRKSPWLLVLAAATVLGSGMLVAQSARRVDEAALRNAPGAGEDWLTVGNDTGDKRYSPLKQIDASNVSRLGLSWGYDIPAAFGGPPGGGTQEATLVASNGTLYGITNWSLVFAIDGRTGKELWKWDPQVNRAAVQPKVCCGIVNRGVALYEGKVIAPVIDGRLVALDAATGRPMWEARVAYPQDQYTLTMAPRIAKGKVVIGGSGAEYPVRGFVDAFDVNTGHRAWRFYTVPGDPSKGFENDAMKKAAATWSGEWWKMGGGATVWDAMSYDPQANLIYFGTGNGGPWPETLRGATKDIQDNLYVCSIIALNPDTGEMKWYYQVVPTDSWDYDSVQQLTLADLTINGRQRRVIMQANKNGFFYVLDRVTGEFISAEPFAPLNWASGIDAKTGRPIIRPEAYYDERQAVTITPGPGGAHNWSPMSFNPQTGLVYIPTTLGSSRTYTVSENFVFREGGRNTGAGGGGGGGAAPAAAAAAPAPVALPPIVPPSIGPTRNGARGGILVAWDPVAQKERWFVEGGGASGGGTLTTGGNLLFQVLADGRLRIFSADKGDKLLEVQTGKRGGMGPPMTYMADGKQYVALMGGRGGAVGAPAPGGGRGAAPEGGRGGAPVPPPTATTSTAPAAGGATADLPRVLTYALDGTAK